MTDFAYRRVAVVAARHLYAHSVMQRTLLLDAHVETIVGMREKKIHPVFVFDGDAGPERQRRLAVDACADVVSAMLDRKMPRERVVRYVEHMRSRPWTATDADYALLRSALDAMGVPWLVAPSEAEPLCAWLCRRGVVAAVASTAAVPRCPLSIVGTKEGFFSCVLGDAKLEDAKLEDAELGDAKLEDAEMAGSVPHNRPIRYDALERWLADHGASTAVDSIRARVG